MELNFLEIFGTIVGLVYLWLEYRASIYLWIAGIVMPAIYLVVYYQAGLYADFGPKPLTDKAGNGMHINFSAASEDKRDVMPQVLAGVLAHVEAMTAFLNPTEESYRRFGSWKAPGYLSWSAENRSQLIRVPAAVGEYLADQLVLPMALAGAGEFTVAHPSCHLLTNIAVVERFLPVRFGFIETDGVTRVSIE